MQEPVTEIACWGFSFFRKNPKRKFYINSSVNFLQASNLLWDFCCSIIDLKDNFQSFWVRNNLVQNNP